MIKFPSIDQFRQVVREVRSRHDFVGKDEEGSAIYRHTSPYPTITFKGTVKLHGTNAGIVKYKDRIEFQSRERVLSLQQDNSQFMLSMAGKNFDTLFGRMASEFSEYIAVFGEWCGQGIQKGVAISGLPKMFVVFAVNVDGQWVSPNQFYDNEQGIYNITQFPTYSVDVDFNSPELSQNVFSDLTIAVENECPVGKHFGVSGIGEGIVWTAEHSNNFYIFKVKGEKHSVTKVKTLASVDVEEIAGIKEFVETTVTEQRLLQGITVLNESGKVPDQKTTGDFLRWVINDIIKEETDTIIANKFDPKKLNPLISNTARVWYFKYLDELSMKAV